MATIFDGLDELCDQFLLLDENWKGAAPRYRHPTTLIRLCAEDGGLVDGTGLVHALYDRVLKTWADAGERQSHLPSAENWRFTKRLNLKVLLLIMLSFLLNI